MARYVPKHRLETPTSRARRGVALAAVAVSSLIGLSGTYGFVPGVQAATAVDELAVVRSRQRVTAAATPTSQQRSAHEVTSTTKAADPLAPRFVEIDTIGIASSLISLRQKDDGTLEVPTVASQAGWYSEGVRPGDKGPAVIVGHVDSYLGPAVFDRLNELIPGDTIRVTRNDGTAMTFVVDRVDQYPKELFPSALVYGPTSTKELRVITCGGQFSSGEHRYLDNVVVYATLASAPI